ncbi:MAG: sporulation protein YqfD [Bacilli bacterium]|nr:sporulation protein YqfD [Bacilli bacterium]
MNSYLLIKVNGRNINKFLLKCHKNNINLINIKYISYKSVIVLINYDDYEKLNRIKSYYELSIISFKGIKGYANKIKKNKIIIFSFIIGLCILIFLSNIIFNIEIESDNRELRDLIRKELISYKMEKYKFRKSFKAVEKIKKNIKNKYKDKIEWLEIKNVGTKYIVYIVERKIDKKKETEEFYSIVSNKSCVIRRISVEKGISLVNKGDYVSKGDILISSDIIYDEEVKNRVTAKGKIYGECWYKVRVEYPLDYTEKKYTNKKRIVPFIRIGSKYIELFNYDNYKRYNLFSYKEKIGNIEFGIEKIKKVIIINDKYSIEKAKKLAIKEARARLSDRLGNDEYIIDENTLNFYSNGSKIILDMFFSVYEEIGERKVIEKGEENGTEDT